MSNPAWAWWGMRGDAVALRHAMRVLEQGAALEKIICQGGPPLDKALQAHQRSRRNMGGTDRLLLGAAAYSLARNRSAIRKAFRDALPGEGRLLALALLDALGANPADVPHLPGGVAVWLTALERLGRMRDTWSRTLAESWGQEVMTASPRVHRAFSNLFAIPGWWLEEGPWKTVGGAVSELALLKRPQRLTLRVQAHRARREEVVSALSSLSIPTTPTQRSPWGLIVEGRHNVLSTDLYRNGLVEVQDEGSQLVACLCDPKPGERILDLCAGGGGKSLALASLLGGRGEIFAHDAVVSRLVDTRRRARRAGLGNIRVLEDPEQLQSSGPFDLVLVDAPCSSSGTLRRNPDAAWRWSQEALVRLVEVQSSILATAANLTRPGGALVYVTCSLLSPENENQIRSFLDTHREFRLSPLGDRRGHAPLLDVPGAEAGVLRLSPTLEGYAGDSFFMARMLRR